MFRIFILLLTLVFILSCGGDTASDVMAPKLLGVVYVDDSAAGNNDGTTWDNAFTDLQMGIDEAAKKATSGYIEVHVAVGTYKPNDNDPLDLNREQHFALKNNVKVIGGYKDNGSGTYTVTEANKDSTKEDGTILSGDIGKVDVDTDNVLHVFYHPSETGLTASAKLENVIITKGNANGSPDNIRNAGGGMYNSKTSPTLTKVIFKDNKAARFGGGMNNNNEAMPTLTDVTFINNTSGNTGGGMNNANGSKVTLINCRFEGNTATLIGGGMYNYRSSPTLTSVTFTGNTAKNGGGMNNFDSSPTLTDCTFTNNTATEKGGAIYSNKGSNPKLDNVKGGADGNTPFTSGTSSTGDTKQNGYHQDPTSS